MASSNKLLEDVSNGNAALNGRDAHGRTPLALAVIAADLEATKTLLSAGAHVNAKDCKKLTPLHHAVLNSGNTCIVSELISNGADVNRQTWRKLTPLMLTLKCKTLSSEEKLLMLKILLEAGADVKDHRDGYGRTHLHWAIKGGSFDIVKLLIQTHGGQSLLKTSDDFRKTAVFEAVRWNRLDILEYLLGLSSEMLFQLAIPDRKLFLPYHYAAKYGYVEILTFLAEYIKIGHKESSVKLNQIMKSNLTPFLAAAAECQIPSINFFLDNDIFRRINVIDDRDEFGSNALILMIIAAFRQQRLIKASRKYTKPLRPWNTGVFILLQNNIDLGCKTKCTIFWPSKNYHAQNALEIATKAGLVQIVKLLAYAGSPLGNLLLDLEVVNDKYLKKNLDLLEWLNDFYHSPRSLKEICRNAFRRFIGGKFISVLPSLFLAAPIRKYLMFSNLEDFIRFDENGEKSEEKIFPEEKEMCESEEEYEASHHGYGSDNHEDEVDSIVDSD